MGNEGFHQGFRMALPVTIPLGEGQGGPGWVRGGNRVCDPGYISPSCNPGSKIILQASRQGDEKPVPYSSHMNFFLAGFLRRPE